jgi:membrane-associated HD superfamily phosphohydrolase
MSAAHEEAARILAEAKAQAEELDARAQSNRERIQEDFDLTMAARRKEALEQAQLLETTSKAEAKERLDTARAEAESTRQRAASAATERVTRAQEVTEQIKTLRARMLTQLAEVRSQLDDVPQLLAEIDDEPELLDADTKGLLNKALSENAQLDQPKQAAAEHDSNEIEETAVHEQADGDAPAGSSTDTVSASYR